MKKMLFLLIMVIFICGCVEVQETSSSMSTKMYANPPSVFINRDVTVYLDIENMEDKNLHEVYAEIFDTGMLSGACNPFYEEIMLPHQSKTLSCTLKAPETINENHETTEVSSSVRFNKDFDIVQIIELVSEEYYNVHLGQIKKKPKLYTYHDKNLEIDIEFNDNLPIVIRPEKKAFMYITIKNIGNGFLTELSKETLSIKPTKPKSVNIVNCNIPDLVPTEKQLPRIACELIMPEGVNYIYNYDVDIKLNYEYETRDKISVNIMK